MRSLSLFVAVVAVAQVETPTIGVMLDEAGAYRPVYGVAGSFTLGPPVEEPVEGKELATPGEVSFDSDGLLLQRPGAIILRFALPRVFAVRAISAEWVQAFTPSGSYALRIETGREGLFLLPKPAQGARRR